MAAFAIASPMPALTPVMKSFFTIWNWLRVARRVAYCNRIDSYLNYRSNARMSCAAIAVSRESC
jgi:hypothetical protein